MRRISSVVNFPRCSSRSPFPFGGAGNNPAAADEDGGEGGGMLSIPFPSEGRLCGGGGRGGGGEGEKKITTMRRVMSLVDVTKLAVQQISTLRQQQQEEDSNDDAHHGAGPIDPSKHDARLRERTQGTAKLVVPHQESALAAGVVVDEQGEGTYSGRSDNNQDHDDGHNNNDHMVRPSFSAHQDQRSDDTPRPRRRGGSSATEPSSDDEAHESSPEATAARRARTRLLERELSELSERTRAALESSWAEIAVLRGERASRAIEVEALEAELRRLGALRESNLRERCGELSLSSGSKLHGTGRSRSRSTTTATPSTSAATSGSVVKRISRCASVPELEELRELNNSNNNNNKSRNTGSTTTTTATRTTPSTSSNSNISSSSKMMPRSQSCLSVPRLAHSAALSQRSSSPTNNDHRRRRSSLTELVSRGIAGIQDQLQLEVVTGAAPGARSNSLPCCRNNITADRSRHPRRPSSSSSVLEDLHHRLAETESSKLRALFGLSDELRRREERLAEAARKIRSQRQESERIRSHIRKVPRLVGQKVRDVQKERGELLAEARALAENVRGKERQMRYLAAGIGEQMAALATATAGTAPGEEV